MSTHPAASRAQQEADAIVRALEARRARAPLAHKLEGRIFSILFGDVAYRLSRAECDEIEAWTIALGFCSERNVGDLDAEAALYYNERLDTLEARALMVGLVSPHLGDRS